MVSLLAPVLALLLAPLTHADTVRVAVAANFADTLRELAAAFEAETATDHQVSVSAGSTGKLYAQIRHGAPFDVFFAADSERPRLLEEAGVGVPGTRATYAVGRLALWVPDQAELADGAAWIRGGGYRHLAIASPRLAPYGRAARQVLRRLQVWDLLRKQLVRGENVGQAFHFVDSGAAQGGFVALSQLRRPGAPARGSTWVVPASMHDPVEQQAILLEDRPAAREFLALVLGPEASPMIEAYGYAPRTHERGNAP